jgi:filamentous hemagglutinin family protein
MKINRCSCRWRLGIVSFLTIGSALAFSENRVIAQVIPDNTLGNERSVVNKVDKLNERIEGGATRGENLFHSFQEFNVGEGKSVYFANPEGITNILSRVTGGNLSQILGRLGVSGTANLFLLNPNGILFGSDASLDIQGSFVATTADGISLGENGFFSASEPQKSRLLSVSPGVTFFEQAANTPGVIVNRGNLAVGKDLTFSAGNLDLQGQLVAGGDLTLQALDTVQIRDSKLNPFVAAAKGDLLVRGNQTVDIFALNHPMSGLFSGGDLVLQSANTVGGDAHFWSGGNFRIEQLDGNLGNLYSPNDPVIRSLGDVSFNIYSGASLHVLAAGAVNIGTVIITGVDTGTLGNDFLIETVQLSNGTELSVNGGIQPTVDIRAGIKPEKIGSAGITGVNLSTDFFFNLINNSSFPETPTVTSSPTNADITIGDIFMDSPGGLVYITNQYEPNSSLPGGEITIIGAGLYQQAGRLGNGIDARGFGGDGSSVILDSRNNIMLAGSFIDSSSTSGDAGNITLIADKAISLTNGASISSITSGQGNAGDINLQAETLSLNNGAFILTTTGNTSTGNAGNLIINASRSVQLVGSNGDGQRSSFLSTDTFGTGNAGNITINTEQLRLKDGASITARTSGEGNAGNLTVNASESVQLIGSGAFQETFTSSSLISSTFGKGNGGDITINTGQLLVRDGASVQTGIGETSEGKGGNLTVNASKSVQLIGFSPFIVRLDNGEETQFISSLTTGTLGEKQAGDLFIATEQLLVKDGAFISTTTEREGNAGKLTVNASESIQLIGTGITIRGRSPSNLLTRTLGKGNAGDITINTERLLVRDGAGVVADTTGAEENAGDAGNLTVNASDSVRIIGASPDGETPSNLSTAARNGNAGNINLTTRQLLLKNGSLISSSTLGEGRGGNLTVNASESVQLVSSPDNNSVLLTNSGSKKGNAGDLNLTTARLLLTDGSRISTETNGSGNAGNLTIDASESIRLNGVRASDGQPTALITRTRGSGNAGILNVTTEQLLVEDEAFISANTSRTGKGGNVNLQIGSLTLNNNAQISALSEGQNNAGNIDIDAKGAIALNNSEITTSAEQSSGGAIEITAGDIRLNGDSDIRTNVANGAGGGGNITLNADSILAYDDSDIFAFARDGKGGNITLGTPVFFGSQFQSAPQGTNPDTLENSDRVDINASGAVAGDVSLPDLSFIENNLTELPQNVINTEDLIANSCVVPNRQQTGTFLITGSGGLPVRPGDASISSYPTAEVRTVSESPERPWQLGDPIVEPQDVYRLPNGRFIMSRQCSE